MSREHEKFIVAMPTITNERISQSRYKLQLRIRKVREKEKKRGDCLRTDDRPSSGDGGKKVVSLNSQIASAPPVLATFRGNRFFLYVLSRTTRVAFNCTTLLRARVMYFLGVNHAMFFHRENRG